MFELWHEVNQHGKLFYCNILWSLKVRVRACCGGRTLNMIECSYCMHLSNNSPERDLVWLGINIYRARDYIFS